MTPYDLWKQTDRFADQQAAYEAKHAALAAQIKAGLLLSDFIKEVECSASFDDKVCQSITQAFLTGADCGAILHAYADQWLNDHADKLALAQLQGVQE
jgi:hypothetical protein